MERNLKEKGFKNLVVWNRAVDTDLFSPTKTSSVYEGMARPIYLNVGRVSVEKNLNAFLSMPSDGTKVIVGDGPQLKELVKKYPEAVFVGAKRGEELAAYFASADVFVFPSLTDTFGLVMIEAMASGLPVAAYPVTGPIDVIQNGENGWVGESLYFAAHNARTVRKDSARSYAVENHGWDSFVDTFLNTLDRIRKDRI